MTDAPPMNDADLRALCERLRSGHNFPRHAAAAIEALVAERGALRAENAELRKHAEAFDKMRKALQGIASCATQCEGCQMMARIAREALK